MIKMNHKIVILFFLISSWYCKAQITMPRIFSDNMVLQRNTPIPIWGNADTASLITIEFCKNTYTTHVNSLSKWMIYLPKMDAGGPYTLIIKEIKNNKIITEKQFQNVMIGDVWFASGQSNMELRLQESLNPKDEIAQAQNPNIRFFQVPHAIETIPQNDFKSGSWKQCDSTTVGDFSAVAYYFSKQIQQEQNVAIGIIESTWGGTPVEAWTSKEILTTIPELATKISQNEAANINNNSFALDKENEKLFFDIALNSLNGLQLHYTENSFIDTSWKTISMPKAFKEIDSSYQGILWLRKTIQIPKSMQGKDLQIHLGYPDMLYNLYFNNHEICKNVWNAEKKHTYTIPSQYILKNNNLITLRLAVMWGGGGLNEPADGIYLTDKSQKISLAGDWKYIENAEQPFPIIKNYQKYPTYMFNGMINPIIPYALKGFLWYQGEENAWKPNTYITMFPLLIQDWRQRWNQGNLPFIYVQLPNFMKRKQNPSESDWSIIREAQAKALSIPNTAMATTIDLGEWDNIHPKNKEEVAYRLALAANHVAYSKDIVYSGPMFNSMEIEDSSIRIHFTNTGGRLVSKGSFDVTGFSIAGADGKYYWATASIDGDDVIVESKNVSKPKSVRYAWGDNPECNLYNKEGLPAVPFRTDK